MKKEFEKRKEMVGLEEINQSKTSEVNGGCNLCEPEPPIHCYFDIPTVKSPYDIFRPIDFRKPI